MLTLNKVIESKRERASWSTGHLIVIKFDFCIKIYNCGKET